MKKVSLPTYIISLIAVVFLSFVVYMNIDNISDMRWSSSTGDIAALELELWDQVYFTGAIFADGDLVTHTHTLVMADGSIVGLKSSARPLTSLLGTVWVTWVVDSLYANLYIISVSQIAVLADDSAMQTGQEYTGSAQYYPQAGLYVDEDTIWLYGNPELLDGKLLFQSNGASYVIDYFVCQKGVEWQDCDTLQNNFSQASSQSYANADGVTLYKMYEANAWFARTELFGYFFNDMPVDTVLDLHKHIRYVTVAGIKKIYARLCTNIDQSIKQLAWITLKLQPQLIQATVTGSGSQGQSVQCLIDVDYRLPYKWTMNAFTVLNAAVPPTTEVAVTPPVSETKPTKTVDVMKPSVSQFALKPEKWLIYTSSRGYTLKFPSPNISYRTALESNDLGIAGTKCSAVIKVSAYANKDTVETNPSIRIWECSTVGKVDTSTTVQYALWKIIFVVQVLDPAWVSFAQNLEFTEL